MSDTFKIQEAITFAQQTPPETFRLMDVTINNIPTAYEHGKVLVAADTEDQTIAEDVNIFVMYCATGVILKVGDTTAPPMENVTHFSYKGNKTAFYVSNDGTEDITITYATCCI
jgi:hypothetical protein